jgi:hypothetical protein
MQDYSLPRTRQRGEQQFFNSSENKKHSHVAMHFQGVPSCRIKTRQSPTSMLAGGFLSATAAVSTTIRRPGQTIAQTALLFKTLIATAT